MNKDKALKLIGKFWIWADKPSLEKEQRNFVQGGIYWIGTFVEWLYDEGYEIKEKK